MVESSEAASPFWGGNCSAPPDPGVVMGLRITEAIVLALSEGRLMTLQSA